MLITKETTMEKSTSTTFRSEGKIFSAPAVIEKVQTLVDGGVKFSVNTPELSPEAMTKLFGLTKKSGYFLFSEASEIDTRDIPDVVIDVDAGEKSPSKRLRNVLYVYWEENTSKKEPFDVFYKKSIEKLITGLKEKLD